MRYGLALNNKFLVLVAFLFSFCILLKQYYVFQFSQFTCQMQAIYFIKTNTHYTIHYTSRAYSHFTLYIVWFYWISIKETNWIYWNCVFVIYFKWNSIKFKIERFWYIKEHRTCNNFQGKPFNACMYMV